ncbi:MAG: thiamine pyrophosphate-binding protein [Chloroflexi bacterium]|nr:thiamine pyrophosphate-binding protein [Chloroflexota bacterium]
MGQVYGGTLVARTLAASGVKHVFGILGHELLTTYDACLDYDIEIIGNRHESAAIHMADAYARVTGKPGVCMFTSGPGHANSVPGATSAHLTDSPLILISATSEQTYIDMNALQEIDQIGMIRPVTKWARKVFEPRRIPEYLGAAFRNALTGRTGPVHLSLPGDVVGRRFDDPGEPPRLETRRATGRAHPEPAGVERAIELLAAAERPVLIVGTSAFWSRAEAELRELVETTQTPAFTLELARGLISDEHPLCYGYADPSLNAPARLFAEADLVIVAGRRMDWRLGFGQAPFFSADAKLVQIDSDENEIGRNRAVDVGMLCDVGAALGDLAKAARGRKWERCGWIGRLDALAREQREQRREVESSDQVPMHPARVAAEIRDFLPADAYLTIDGGDFCHWNRMTIPARQPAGFMRTFPLGGLGLALPFAIGAKLARPDKPALCISGDGAFGFYAFELDTAVRHNAPIVTVVGVDAAWGIEKHAQEGLFGPDRLAGSLLRETRHDLVAEGLGAYGQHVERPEELRPALQRAFESGRPSLIDVRIKGTSSPMTERLIRRKREIGAM